MFKNYLKFAFRNLIRNKFFSIINIFGLTIGITTCIMIFLFVNDEFQYGQNHPQKENIYRLLRGKNVWSAVTAGKLLPVLNENIPAIKSSVRVKNRKAVITYNEIFNNESNVIFADSNFIEFFDWDLLIGNKKTALKNHNSVVLTQEMANKYFGTENPMGKVIKIDNKTQVIVSGILKECPKHQPIELDFLVNIEVLRITNSNAMTNWDNNSFHSYILLYEHAKTDSLAINIRSIVAKVRGWGKLGNAKYHLQAYTDIHLHSSHISWDTSQRGNASVVYSFLGIAILVLILACFNYTNLSTAQSAKRAKEIGLRKTIGASRLQLIFQFLLEVIILTIISIILSLILVETMMPWFNQLTNKSLSIYALDPFVIAASILLFLTIVSLMAGFYPSFVLSGYQPIKVLKGGGSIGFDVMKSGGGCDTFPTNYDSVSTCKFYSFNCNSCIN